MCLTTRQTCRKIENPGRRFDTLIWRTATKAAKPHRICDWHKNQFSRNLSCMNWYNFIKLHSTFPQTVCIIRLGGHELKKSEYACWLWTVDNTVICETKLDGANGWYIWKRYEISLRCSLYEQIATQLNVKSHEQQSTNLLNMIKKFQSCSITKRTIIALSLYIPTVIGPYPAKSRFVWRD